MKNCVVCKTPIADGLEIETKVGFVHPGACAVMVEELSKVDGLNESTELLEEKVEDIQLLL